MNMIVFETSGPGESGRADKILYEDFEQPAEETVLIQSEEYEADSPEFQAVIQEVVDEVGALDEVAALQSPLDEEASGLVSPDRRQRSSRSSTSVTPKTQRTRPTR